MLIKVGVDNEGGVLQLLHVTLDLVSHTVQDQHARVCSSRQVVTEYIAWNEGSVMGEPRQKHLLFRCPNVYNLQEIVTGCGLSK